MKLKNLRPILWTKDLQATIHFYTDILGFSCRKQLPDWAALTKDDIEIMISVAGPPSEDCIDPKQQGGFFLAPKFTGSIYMDIEGVDEYWEKTKDKVKVNYGVENMEWGMREFSIYDNNGYELVFGQKIFKAVYKHASPYKDDAMNLPVADVLSSIPFYEKFMGFRLISMNQTPHYVAIFERDDIQIGLAENGGDPTQEGCFFEVDNVQNALIELKSNGLKKEFSEIRVEQHGSTTWNVFYVIAPDGLCYCIGQRES
ncbi:MAG: VOC family protein [Saprospiraceae bacterium]